LVGVYRGCGPQAPRVPPLAWWIGGPWIAILGLHALTTASIGYDSAWYHLPIAEGYAATGAIGRFGEGWFLGSYPHMASIFYAWGMLAAKGAAMGLVTCGFIEYSFVLAALLGVVPLARALLRRRPRLAWAWAVAAAFPALVLYAPHLEADYLAASFGPPLLLLTLKVWRDFEPRSLALWAALLAATINTKYSAVTVCLFPCCAVALRASTLLLRAGPARRCALLALAIAVSVALLGTATFWLKNWVFYGNPVYPMLVRWFGGKPWTGVAPDYYAAFLLQHWRPASGWDGLLETVGAMFTFSFKPHEWPQYNPGQPIFGSLFTLTLPVLLVLRAARRVLTVHLAVLAGIALWFNLHHQDRYLLALLPWMIAVTAATLALLWRAGMVSKVVVVVVAILQLGWGMALAVQFFPYAGLRDALVAKTGRDWSKTQLARWQGWVEVGRRLPLDAKVLVHDQQVKFGIRRATVSDLHPYQGGISYVEMATDARVFDVLTELGVTHLHSGSSSAGVDALGGDLVFHGFFARYGLATDLAELRAMPAERPLGADPEHRLVLLDSCGTVPESKGVYRVVDLWRPGVGNVPQVPATPLWGFDQAMTIDEIERALLQCEFVVLDTACSDSTLAQRLHARFVSIATRGALRLWLRAWEPVTTAEN
jgi:hypothetical protein